MLRVSSHLRVALGVFALLLAAAAFQPARAEHGLEELKATYLKECNDARAWYSVLNFFLLPDAKRAQDAAEANGCFGSNPTDICEGLLKKVAKENKLVAKAAQGASAAVARCDDAKQAYSQALTEVILTKWLTGEDSPEYAKLKKKSAPKKSAKKKKESSRRSRTSRRQTKPSHTSNASAAAAMVIIGIVGGYLGSKAARKRSKPSGGRRGGHHHPGSSYN
ncbi:MAG: hypothetical protein OEM91_07585 [Hyphomicrobiales bacterium]|nr:hypothetical protein [Hyphomicrobiales bacterium]